MSNIISQSRFYMWRTVFAVAHADGVVTDEEVKFMARILEDVDFSTAQKFILRGDIADPKDCEQMFEQITDPKDRAEFFDFARDLVHADGEFGAEEQSVMADLYKKHFQEADIDKLIGTVSLELEEGTTPVHSGNTTQVHNVRKGLFSFYNRFLGRDG